MPMMPALENVADFVREFAGLKRSFPITERTKLDADLGVTGDDGDQLLREAAKRFQTVLADEETGYRSTFLLADDEYLFHAEGLEFFGVLGFARRICGSRAIKVRDLTVGELHAAIRRARDRIPRDGTVGGEGP